MVRAPRTQDWPCPHLFLRSNFLILYPLSGPLSPPWLWGHVLSILLITDFLCLCVATCSLLVKSRHSGLLAPFPWASGKLGGLPGGYCLERICPSWLILSLGKEFSLMVYAFPCWMEKTWEKSLSRPDEKTHMLLFPEGWKTGCNRVLTGR